MRSRIILAVVSLSCSAGSSRSSGSQPTTNVSNEAFTAALPGSWTSEQRSGRYLLTSDAEERVEVTVTKPDAPLTPAQAEQMALALTAHFQETFCAGPGAGPDCHFIPRRQQRRGAAFIAGAHGFSLRAVRHMAAYVTPSRSVVVELGSAKRLSPSRVDAILSSFTVQ